MVYNFSRVKKQTSQLRARKKKKTMFLKNPHSQITNIVSLENQGRYTTDFWMEKACNFSRCELSQGRHRCVLVFSQSLNAAREWKDGTLEIL